MSHNSQPPRGNVPTEQYHPVRSRERILNPPSNLTLLFQNAREATMTDEMLLELLNRDHIIDQHLMQQHRERVQRRYGEQLLDPSIPVNPRPDAEDIAHHSRTCRIRELDAADVVREGLQLRQTQMLEAADVTKALNTHSHPAAKRKKMRERAETESVFFPEHTDDESLGGKFEIIDNGNEEDCEVIGGCVASASNGAAGHNQGGTR